MPPELLFVGVALCGGVIGFATAGGFKNRAVMIGLVVAALGGLVSLFIEWEKLC